MTPLRGALLWIAAVVVAVLVSSVAVTLATDSVTAPPPIAVASPDDDPTAGTDDDPSPTPSTGPSPSATPTGDAGEPTATPTAAGTDTPTPTPSTTASATPAPTPTPTPGDDASPADDDGGTTDAPTEQTATSVGGTARFRFADGTVTLLFATPASGFTADVETDDDSVRVTFTSTTHESRIDADWEDGVPRVRVREEADD